MGRKKAVETIQNKNDGKKIFVFAVGPETKRTMRILTDSNKFFSWLTFETARNRKLFLVTSK